MPLNETDLDENAPIRDDQLARSLLEGGVIDEIGFNVHPVMLGEGIPLFHEMKRQIDLELLDCRRFNNGCVYVLYRVKKRLSKR